MKKLKYLIILLFAVFIIPTFVFAEGEENTNTTEKKEVPVYLFHGDGCGFCASAKEWFASIEEEHGSKFEIIDYETWHNTDNAELMEEVADVRGEVAEGVPYIIVGNKSWNGFTEEMAEEILSEINSVYEQEEKDRYDVMNFLEDTKKKEKEKGNSGDVVALILIVLVSGGIGFGIYQARKSTN